MLGVNQLDFINYANALKGNYRKGIHKMEAIMASPTHAKEFASNLGGVSVVLSVPIGKEDRNSAQLLDLLLNSDVADDAVYTWLGQFYEFSSWDDLLGDESRCNEIMNDPLKSRAVSGSGVAVGKMVATIAGLSCSAYADMSAVAASSTAMAAVTESYVAVAAVYGSAVAVEAVKANETAWSTLTGASSAVMGKAAAKLAGLNPADYADMAAVASSSTAMAAVIGNSAALNAVVSSHTAMAAVASSSTAMAAIEKSQTAKGAIAASDMATAKYAAGAAGLNPADYANMAAIASSSTAMAAVATSDSAIRAMVASTAAKTALIANNNNLQSVANTWWKTVQSGFTLVRSQKDDDGVTSANSVNAKYIMFAIPGGYNNGSGITNCFHGHNGAAAGSASGSYTDTAKRKVLLGGGTFTETNDGMVRTWVYSI